MFTTRNMALAALMAAMIAALAQVAIPLPFTPVAITGQIFGVFLAGAVLGANLGTMSILVYVLLGAIGLPVFAKGGAGLGVLLGPSGGYIWGFILGTYVLGKIVEAGVTEVSYLRLATGMLVCLLIVYTLGTLQLAFLLRLTFLKALLLGVIPYIPLDMAKLLVASGLSLAVRRSLAGAGLLPGSRRF
ncbi:MAG: biotin transport system substrate-specific component [Clostridia bacterium]|nr:biotin transport system substrate-specific component [Clostridia bacterium]